MLLRETVSRVLPGELSALRSKYTSTDLQASEHFLCSASQPHVYSSSAKQLHAHLCLVSKLLNINEDTKFAKITAQAY